MDNVLLLVLVVAVAASGAAVALLVLRKRDPVRAELIEQALLAVARTINQSLDEDEIRAVASWIYDALGVSAYYSKEQWIAYCLRMLRQADAVAQTAPASLWL